MPSRLAVVAIDLDVRLQPVVLQVARDVGELAAAARSRSTSLGAHSASSSMSRILERELILRAADAVLDRQVLHRLHVQRDAGDVGELRLQPADDVDGARVALVERLQVDQDAAAVERRVRAVDADERREALDRRVFQQHVGERLLPLGHRGERDVCGASVMPWITPVSCTGKKPFGHRRCRARPSAPAWRPRRAASAAGGRARRSSVRP